jgi:hypothetical protein
MADNERRVVDFLADVLPDMERGDRSAGVVRGAGMVWPAVAPEFLRERIGEDLGDIRTEAIPGVIWPTTHDQAMREAIHKSVQALPFPAGYGAAGALGAGSLAALAAYNLSSRQRRRNAVVAALIGMLGGGIAGEQLGEAARNDIERRVLAEKGFQPDDVETPGT